MISRVLNGIESPGTYLFGLSAEENLPIIHNPIYPDFSAIVYPAFPAIVYPAFSKRRNPVYHRISDESDDFMFWVLGNKFHEAWGLHKLTLSCGLQIYKSYLMHLRMGDFLFKKLPYKDSVLRLENPGPFRNFRGSKSSLALLWKDSSYGPSFRPSLKSILKVLNGLLKVGLVVSICVIFPSKVSACLVNQSEVDPNLIQKKRKLLVRVFVVGAGVAAVATLSYALFYSPKIKLSDRLLAVSKFVGLSSGVIDKVPEFLKIPDFLPMQVTPDIASELSKTAAFLRKAQFDKSYSDPRNKFLAEALLTVLFGRVDGLLSHSNSPDFSPSAMRSIESAMFIMCRKNRHTKSVCATLKMDRLLLKLAESLYKHQNSTRSYTI